MRQGVKSSWGYDPQIKYFIKMHKIDMQLDLSSLHYFFSFNTLGTITLKTPLELFSILENGREWQERKPHPIIHTLMILIVYYSVFQKMKHEEWLNALPKVTDLYEVGTTEIWVLTLILCSYNYVTMSYNLQNLNLDDLKIYSI